MRGASALHAGRLCCHQLTWRISLPNSNWRQPDKAVPPHLAFLPSTTTMPPELVHKRKGGGWTAEVGTSNRANTNLGEARRNESAALGTHDNKTVAQFASARYRPLKTLPLLVVLLLLLLCCCCCCCAAVAAQV